MKIKIEFAVFKEQLMAPGQLGAETTLAKTETKHKEMEMEFDSDLQMLVVQMKKDSKPILVPMDNVRDMVAAGPLTPPKKANT